MHSPPTFRYKGMDVGGLLLRVYVTISRIYDTFSRVGFFFSSSLFEDTGIVAMDTRVVLIRILWSPVHNDVFTPGETRKSITKPTSLHALLVHYFLHLYRMYTEYTTVSKGSQTDLQRIVLCVGYECVFCVVDLLFFFLHRHFVWHRIQPL